MKILALIACLLITALVPPAADAQASGMALRIERSIANLRDAGLLPAWATPDDEYTGVLVSPTLGGICVVDRETRATWVLSGRPERARRMANDDWTAWAETLAAGGGPVDVGVVARCGDWFKDRVPRATGQPAYYGITCVDSCGPNGIVDWAAMTGSIAGQTLPGEPCLVPPSATLPSPGEGYVWGEIARLRAANGPIALTRCIE
jgi:hypothetical protein